MRRVTLTDQLARPVGTEETTRDIGDVQRCFRLVSDPLIRRLKTVAQANMLPNSP
jgi:hypothetical protein